MEGAGKPLSTSPHKGKTGLRRIWNAIFYSIDGFRAAYRHEDAFRQEVLLAALLIPVALFVPASGTGKAVMIASVLLVLLVELLNSAVEATVDRMFRMRHADGSFRWMLCRGLAVHGPTGAALRVAGSQTDVTARREAEDRLRREALHDPLTGLYNRRQLLTELDAAVALARRHVDRTRRDLPFGGGADGIMHSDQLGAVRERRLDLDLRDQRGDAGQHVILRQ